MSPLADANPTDHAAIWNRNSSGLCACKWWRAPATTKAASLVAILSAQTWIPLLSFLSPRAVDTYWSPGIPCLHILCRDHAGNLQPP